MSVIESTYIEINNKINNHIRFEFLDENQEFGILNIKTKEVPITKTDTLFLFTIDITGSMNETADGKNTKLDIVKQTFKSMIHYLCNLDAPISIRIHTFNTEVFVLMDTINIKDKESLKELYIKIDELFADDSTNIELALKSAMNYMDSYIKENPTHQISHIFMTDGNATAGNTHLRSLCNIVNNTYHSIFIGFGKDHNIDLMKQMATNSNIIYQFINDMENSSTVYGEAIHQYLYPAIINAEIEMVNSLIYNWKTNSWTDTIEEPVISSKTHKIYHIKKNKNEDAYANIYGITCKSETLEESFISTSNIVPHLFNPKTNEENIIDLTMFMLRQKTLNLLFQANKVSISTREIRLLREKLRQLFNEIRNYMRLNQLTEDSFMKNLCDDICITYRNIGTSIGNMYISSRLTSQGRQQTYVTSPNQSTYVHTYQSPSLLTIFTPSRHRRKRVQNTQDYFSIPRNTSSNIDEFNLETPNQEVDDDMFNTSFIVENENIDAGEITDDEIDTYVINSNNTSCYADESTLHTISQMSQIHNFTP
jgi:hypothetical protein